MKSKNQGYRWERLRRQHVRRARFVKAYGPRPTTNTFRIAIWDRLASAAAMGHIRPNTRPLANQIIVVL